MSEVGMVFMLNLILALYVIKGLVDFIEANQDEED